MSATFYPLTIAEIVQETADVVSLRFAVPEPLTTLFAFKPGQHLTLRTTINGEDVRRNYSLCTAPLEGILKIAIKRIACGVFSNWAAATLRAGDSIDVMPPHGSFTTDFTVARTAHYVAFAGGSGITPILSLVKAALATEPHSRFTLFYGNCDSNSVIFLEELAALKNRNIKRLALYHILSGETDDIALLGGMLDREKCDELLGTLGDVARISDFFICGPGPMMDAAEAALVSRCVARDRIHIERFTVDRPAERPTAVLEQAAGAMMTVTLDGRTRTIAFDAKAGNILDSARASGLPAPYACKSGVCATCRARLISGKITMAARYGLTDAEIAAGYVLTCQSIPHGGGIALDYDG